MAESILHRDLEIQRQVMQELHWDSRVDPAGIGVAVQDGVVTLTGVVSNYVEKSAVQEAAHRALGVLDVANDIEVIIAPTHARTDAEIAHAIRNSLEWNALLPASEIHTTVSNGIVMISGTVHRWQQRLAAEDSIRILTGVRGVINNLRVIAPPIEVSRLSTLIEDALERRADREARRIRVEVSDDGVVALHGSVRTWLDKQAVLGVVGHAPGVRDVQDNLRIDPYL